MGLADALIPGVASNASNLVARKQLKFKEFTASGTFVVGTTGDATSAATVFNILLVGAGGGGGMGSITAVGAGTVCLAVGGAGGGGEVRELSLPGLTMLNGASTGTVTVTIGAGGVGGASSNGGTAAVGGDSSFGAYTAFGGGRAGSAFRNLGTTTSVSKKYRATGASSENISVGSATANRVTSSSGAGGGARFSDYAVISTSADQSTYFYGAQNGRISGGTIDNTYTPDSQLPPEFDNNASDNSLRPWCGLEANTTFSSTGVSNGWYGRGGSGVKGLGGGGAGAIASYAGTTIAQVLVLPANYWATDYNQAYFYSVDGGGRGAIVTGNATANYVSATSGTANTGGGGGGGAAWATASTVYNSVSSGGSGAAGYCLVYWWE